MLRLRLPFSKRLFLSQILFYFVILIQIIKLNSHATRNKKENENKNKISVIIDTDLGPDVDDAFAIAYLINNKNLDIKLITTCQQNTTRHAILVAKMLKEIGRTDIPIGIGISTPYNSTESSGAGPLFKWGEDFSLAEYSKYGKIIYNGIDEMLKEISKSSEDSPVHILAIGPLTNIAQILTIQPDIKNKIKLFLMGGSVYTGLHGGPKLAEYNIILNITAAQKVFNTNFTLSPIVVTPLDTSSYIQILNKDYLLFLDAARQNCKIAKVLLDIYKAWFENGGFIYQPFAKVHYHPNNCTSPLYDVQAALSLKYFSQNYNSDNLGSLGSLDNMPFLQYEKIKIKIDDKGFMQIEDHKNEIETPVFLVATKFKNNEIDINSKFIEEDILNDIISVCETNKIEF